MQHSIVRVRVRVFASVCLGGLGIQHLQHIRVLGKLPASVAHSCDQPDDGHLQGERGRESVSPDCKPPPPPHPAINPAVSRASRAGQPAPPPQCSASRAAAASGHGCAAAWCGAWAPRTVGPSAGCAEATRPPPRGTRAPASRGGPARPAPAGTHSRARPLGTCSAEPGGEGRGEGSGHGRRTAFEQRP